MFHYKKGMAYKTTADSTSLYADALASTLLNDVFCYFVHHLPKFQNMHPYRIAADTDIEKHVTRTSKSTWPPHILRFLALRLSQRPTFHSSLKRSVPDEQA
jgi:hypothetical protein